MMNGYSLYDYGTMVEGVNRRRADAFTEALRRNVTPESVVLDIGTGSGYFAMIAAKLGAKHVYGIETNPVVKMAERLAADNGLAEKITFYHEDSTKIDLPRKADIVLGDLGGALPIAGPHIPAFIDARERHLAPGGILLPNRVRVLGGVVRKTGNYRLMTEPWEKAPFDLDLHRARAEVVNTPRKVQVKDDQLLSDADEWFQFDYATVDSPHATGELSLTILREDTAHGLALWLEYDFGDDIILSAHPQQEPLNIYGQWFLPWPEPVDLRPDDRVEATIRARKCKQNFNYIWSWDTCVRNADGDEKANFEQASLPALTV